MSGKIIVNHDVLLPEYLPSKLLFRENEYRELEASVENRVSVVLVGPVGSGKTSLVKLLQNKLGADRLVYVDCLVRDTEFSVLKAIVPSTRAAFMRSTFELIEELRRISQSIAMTVCFDNFVRLRDMNIIDKVSALGITVILVSSVERDLQLLSANATPKFTGIVKLKNYSFQEAMKILNARAEHGLLKGSYNDETLRSIIDSTDGNITLGINVLKAVASKVETEERNMISLEDVVNFLPKNREDLELTEDERVIMGIIREKISVEHKQLYNLYCQSATSPKQERTFRNYMQRLIAKSLVRTDFSNGIRTYEVVDNYRTET